MSDCLFFYHAEIHCDSWPGIMFERAIVCHTATMGTAYKLNDLIAPAISSLAMMTNTDADTVRWVVSPECLVTTADRAITSSQAFRVRGRDFNVLAMAMYFHKALFCR